MDGEYRPDTAPLTDIADASIGQLQQVSESVSLSERRALGSPDAPGPRPGP